MPVLYANVTATVERPGTTSLPPVDVDLFDNGAGKKKKKKARCNSKENVLLLFTPLYPCLN